MAGFKVEVLDMWSKPFSAGEIGIWRFAPDGREHKTCTGLGFTAILCSAFLTHFSVGVFSVAGYIGIAQLVFGFSSDKTALCVAVYLLYPWKKGNSGTYYVTFLVQSLYFYTD